ncbi:hypothetical protein [Raineya orbicola]|jgi:hypothetical protein|uniref:Uncharacterized protein n=1 Tax=Raineya orbicola TaxID=2016530 RepID=A0A2N3IHA3_9BACT|nr:hypothetical protein [Raineya orbicola]PKQ69671.1 hypothetical protein Rain11_1343 [Raineya orbicola]
MSNKILFGYFIVFLKNIFWYKKSQTFLLEIQQKWIFYLILTFSACKNQEKINQNWYHWKGTLQLDSLERKYAEQLQSKTLYLRFFDVDFHPEQKAIPIGDLQIQNSDIKPFQEVVAVIFITNRTILQSTPNEIKSLAEKITQKIFSKAQNNKLSLQGIQIDCDWSEKSKENFFLLCKTLKKICKDQKLSFSVTIRLHQYKYFSQTGVPDADEGILMLYNIGDIEGKNTENSILDLSLIDKYLQDTETYPLPLKIALPVFQWAVVKRMGKVVHLLSEITEKDLEQNPHLKKIQEKRYKVQKNHYFGGVFLYEQDELRWESVSLENIEKLTKKVASKIPITEMIFYHLDNQLIQQYPYEKLQNLVHYWF